MTFSVLRVNTRLYYKYLSFLVCECVEEEDRATVQRN
jgi:hypothetical protein